MEFGIRLPAPLSTSASTDATATTKTGESLASFDAFLDSEFDMVKQAVYTEPADQSAWLYHRWLLGQVVGRWDAFRSVTAKLGIPMPLAATGTTAAAAINESSPGGIDHIATVFNRELKMTKDLLELEENSKWVLLAHVILLACVTDLERIVAVLHTTKAERATAAASASSTKEQMRSILDRLRVLDTSRAQYYVSLIDSLCS